MKIGELYYGVTIPQSEFRRVEQQLKRFETAMKQAGGRAVADSLRDTSRAAKETSEALDRLNKQWITLQNQYVTNEIGTETFIAGSRAIQQELGNEIDVLRARGQETAAYESLQTRVTKNIASEQERLTRATREQGLASKDATYTNTRYAESSRLLADRLRQTQMAISNIAANEKAGIVTKVEALRLFRLQQEELLRLRTAYQSAGIAASEMSRATISINTAIKGVSGQIEGLRLKTEGFNTATLEGVKLSDSLTKAWLIGLGPQGYRLYLVMDVLKETMTGVSTSVRGAKNAFLALQTVLKVGVIGTVLAAVGAIIAGLNQMLKIEDIMADVRKTTNLTRAEIQTLTDAFRSLSVQLPTTVAELGEIATAAGQFGIRGTKNIFEFTRAIAELNLAVNDLGDDPATKIVRFLNVMGVSLDRAGEAATEIAGILNELENNTAATAGEILHMASGLAQLGIVADVSTRDVLAMSAGLVSMGINAEMAGSNLTKMFVEVVGDIAKGTEAVNQWAAAAGMSRDEFVALTRESNGFSKAFRAVAINLGAAGLSAEELTVALENLGVTNIRERRIMLSLAAGWRTFADAVDFANDEAATADSIQRELAIRLGVTSVQIQILKNRFSAMVQIIGEYVLPRFAALIDGGNEGGKALAYFGAAVVVLFEGLMALGSALKASWLGVKSLGLYVVGALAGMTTGLNSWSLALENTMRRWRNVFQDIDWVAMITPGGAYTELNKIFDNMGREWAESLQGGFFDSNAAADWFRDAEVAAFAAGDALAAYHEWRPRDTWEEVFQKLLLEMPEMADAIQRLRDEASRDIDPSLFETLDAAGGKSGQTIEGLIAQLYALLAAIDRLKPVMDELGKEYDVNAEKAKALETAITKLVMDFRLDISSPELRPLIDMLKELGVNAEEVYEKILNYQEALTANWVRKLVLSVEYGDMSASDALHQVETAIARLRAEAAEVFGDGVGVDWARMENLDARINILERASAIFKEIAAIDIPMPVITLGAGRGPEPAPGLLEDYVLWAGRLREAQEAWNEQLGETVHPLQRVYDSLLEITNLGTVTDFGLLTDDLREFVTEVLGMDLSTGNVEDAIAAFADLSDAAEDMLANFAKVHFPELFGEETQAAESMVDVLLDLKDGAALLAEEQRKLTNATSESENPIGHLYYRLLELAEGSDLAAEAAQNMLEKYRDVWREMGLLGDAPIVGISDDPSTPGKGLAYQASVEELLDKMQGDWNRVFTQSSAPVVTLRRELEALANGSMPEVAHAAAGHLRAFDDTFKGTFNNAIEQVQMLSAVMAGTYPEGTLKPYELELQALGEELRIREGQLVQAAHLYGRNSDEVAALQVVIRNLRAEIQRLNSEGEYELELQERLREALTGSTEARERQMNLLQDSIRDIIAATEPQLTQTQRQIQHYENLLPLLGRLAPFLKPYIELLKDKDAVEASEALSDAQERANALMGNGRTAIQSYILDLIELKGVYPELEDAIDGLIAKLEEYEAAQGGGDADDPLAGFREQLDSLQGKAKNPFTKLISDMEIMQASGDEINAELQEMIDLAKELSGAWEMEQALDEFADKLDVAFFAARKVFDLMQDGNWTNGNELLSAFYEIGAAVVSMIPVIGPALSKIISMVGEFVNAIIGDMSNGVRQVRQQVDDLAANSKFIGPELAESLTATERVSRGGLLGWLGFTKEAVNEELTGLRIGIAESFGQALKSGITAALAGDQDWKTKLEEGLRTAIMDALLNAFIESMLLTAGLADFINDFTRILLEEGPERAAEYAADHMDAVVDTIRDGAEILVDAMTGYGFASPAPPGEGGDDFYPELDDPDWFSLPTATPGIITATPAWVDNLGMHFAKFGMYVDRLVDEGITVNVNSGAGASDGVTANDVRLLR